LVGKSTARVVCPKIAHPFKLRQLNSKGAEAKTGIKKEKTSTSLTRGVKDWQKFQRLRTLGTALRNEQDLSPSKASAPQT
jgi:hypothetical protein